MKDSWEWNEEDLLWLIRDEIKENSTLEYKSGRALGKEDKQKNEISKDISAFANAVGGTIIYGVVETGKPPTKPISLDGVDPSVISKEWLEQVISSRIQPRISGIRINPVSLSTMAPGSVAYVVCIPEGTTAHQAHDHKYYKRFNFQSVPMEDYEVRLTMNRLSHPEITAEVTPKNRTPDRDYDNRGEANIRLSIQLKNVGKWVADHVYLECIIPQAFIYGHIYRLPSEEIVNIDGISYRKFCYYHQQPHGLFPLFPGAAHEVLDGNYHYVMLYLPKTREDEARKASLLWTVYADNAEPKGGSMPVYELFFPPSVS